MRDQRLYIYKVRVDDGGAPCVDESLWSLAICKPAIRRTAQVGDVIYAFGTNGESPSNRLVCIAEVTETYSGQEYFELSEFKHRGTAFTESTETVDFTSGTMLDFTHRDSQFLEILGSILNTKTHGFWSVPIFATSAAAGQPNGNPVFHTSKTG